MLIATPPPRAAMAPAALIRSFGAAEPQAGGAAANARPLQGRIVGIDPGHNGRNWADPRFIDRPIFNGREREACDTTGTATAAGYTEALFNWQLARDLRADLTREGARVVMTRHSNDGIGPCVTTRARIIDRARAGVAIDIHADGGPGSGRGFAILTPVADRTNHRVVGASQRLARELRSSFRPLIQISNYDGVDGLQARDDLAGLNLTTVPKVLIECGNMRNPLDARLLRSRRWRQQAAHAIAQALTRFLER